MLTLALAPVLQAAAPATTAATTDMKGALIGLALGALQLLVSLVIFTFAINNGLKVVSRMIEGIDIWGEIKKKNMAVALLAAGAVIAYVNVVAGGVESMTSGLTSVVSGSFKSGLSALIGGIVNLIVALIVAGFAISWTFKVADRLTASINEKGRVPRRQRGHRHRLRRHPDHGASDLIAAGVAGVSQALTTTLNVIMNG
ncbi:MAG: hypothetical protein U0802_11925 [Candidatus Binatia bacterium]